MSVSTVRRGWLSRPRRTTGLLIALALAVACGAGTAARRGPDGTTAKPTTTCRTGDPRRLLVAAGENPYDAGLYRVDVCAGTASRVGNYGRISSLAAAAGVIAVAAAPERNDHMFRLHGSELRPLFGTNAPRGSSPAVSADGRRVAYVEVAAEFLLREVANGKLRTLHRSKKPLTPIAYAPSGALLVAETYNDVSSTSVPEPVQLLTVEPDGRARKFAQLPSAIIDGLAVSRSGEVAVSLGGQQPGTVLDRTGRVRGAIAPGLRVVQYLRGSGDLLVLSRDNRLGRFTVSEPLSGATPTWIDLPNVGTMVGVSEL